MKLKKWEIALICSFFCILTYATLAQGFATGIGDQLIRLHIRGNSNTAADQALKLQVRDRILKDFDFQGESRNAARLSLLTNLDAIEAVAKEEMQGAGYDYSVHAHLKDTYFPFKRYESIQLPAGRYKSLVVEIGEGQGENWWCIVYPSLCISYVGGSDAPAEETLTRDQAAFVKGEKYEIRFKTAEIFAQVKEALLG